MNSPQQFGWFYRLQKGTAKYVIMAISALLAVVMTIGIFSPKEAVALDQIKIMYGPASISVSVPELVQFAQTGEQSQQLRSFFLLANAGPEDVAIVREVLSYEVTLPTDFVKSLLDTTYGRLAIGLFSRLFVEESAAVSRIADDLMAGFMSLTGDGRFSIVEMLQTYTFTDQVVVKLDGLVDLYQQGVVFFNQGMEFLKAQPTVQRLICS